MSFSSHESRCTPAMLAALADASRPEGLSPWAHGSSTIGAVKRCGLVRAIVKVDSFGKRSTRYELTDSGRAALTEGR